MGDNAAMTDRSNDPDTHDTDMDLQDLESADPADAPAAAEDLADRLARELDTTVGTRPLGPQDPS